MNIEAETVDRIAEFGAKAPELVTIEGGRPVVVVPSACEVKSLAAFFPPLRIERKVVLLEHGSFADYVNRFKTGNTVIFADVTDTGAKFTALLDYHGAAPELVPAHCAHVAMFETLPTAEWKDWMANNGQRMNQEAFATFLEEHQKMIQDPPGAELLEMVQSLTGKNDARFNMGVKLKSGAINFKYEEDVVLKGTASTKEGELEFPSSLKAGIAPFQGTDPYEVNARLKFRIESRRLNLWYETITPHLIVRDAVLGITKAISEKTSLLPFIGRA